MFVLLAIFSVIAVSRRSIPCMHAGPFTCGQQQQWGNCDQPWMTSPPDPNAALVGGYCARTCGRCTDDDNGAALCINRPAPGGFSCAERKAWGACNEWWMRSDKYCGKTNDLIWAA